MDTTMGKAGIVELVQNEEDKQVRFQLFFRAGSKGSSVLPLLQDFESKTHDKRC